MVSEVEGTAVVEEGGALRSSPYMSTSGVSGSSMESVCGQCRWLLQGRLNVRFSVRLTRTPYSVLPSADVMGVKQKRFSK